MTTGHKVNNKMYSFEEFYKQNKQEYNKNKTEKKDLTPLKPKKDKNKAKTISELKIEQERHTMKVNPSNKFIKKYQ